MSVEVFNSFVNSVRLHEKSVIVRNAHKSYSEVISMKGLNMSVTAGSMYVIRPSAIISRVSLRKGIKVKKIISTYIFICQIIFRW